MFHYDDFLIGTFCVSPPWYKYMQISNAISPQPFYKFTRKRFLGRRTRAPKKHLFTPYHLMGSWAQAIEIAAHLVYVVIIKHIDTATKAIAVYLISLCVMVCVCVSAWNFVFVWVCAPFCVYAEFRVSSKNAVCTFKFYHFSVSIDVTSWQVTTTATITMMTLSR